MKKLKLNLKMLKKKIGHRLQHVKNLMINWDSNCVISSMKYHKFERMFGVINN